MQDLQTLRDEALRRLAEAGESDTLEAWRIQYLGRKGTMLELLRGIPDLPAGERPAFGQAATVLKQGSRRPLKSANRPWPRRPWPPKWPPKVWTSRYPAAGRSLAACTPPTTPCAISTRSSLRWASRCSPAETWRPTSTTSNCSTFRPVTRLARSGQLIHHQSRRAAAHAYEPGQLAAMCTGADKPIRVILPGICHRKEQVTARAEMMFHQVEGLAIGRNITMADLKGVIVEFANQLYGAGRKLRFRCSHFPFT